MIFLAPPFDSRWQNENVFNRVCELEGEIYREVKSRRTLRFKFADKYFFAKIHFGIGWREVLKDLTQLRLPIVSARNEWDAIRKLNQLNLDTMTAVGYGSEGLNPAKIRSFIITEELKDTVTLEDFCRDWIEVAPRFKTKLAILVELANISRTMHGAGMCHRDFYLCHFHLHRSSLANGKPRLSLIDLHRALIKKNLAKRWLVKDIAGLYFSAMEIGLTDRDKLRFIKLYSGLSLRESLRDAQGFWTAVEARATKLYEKEKRLRRVVK